MPELPLLAHWTFRDVRFSAAVRGLADVEREDQVKPIRPDGHGTTGMP